VRSLNICIDLPGRINHGLWSPERGESRWAQNLARGLAERGHKVTGYSYMFGGPSWGCCPAVPGVRLAHYNEIRNTGPYDVFIDNCFWEGKALAVEARLNVIGKYGSEEWTKELPDNCLVASPFDSVWLPQHPKARWLPVPFWKELGESKFDKTAAFIPSRDCCSQGEQRAKAAATTLEAVKTLGATRHHFIMALLQNNGIAFIETPAREGELELRNKYQIVGLAKALSSPLFYGPIPLNKIEETLNSCKLNVPLINPAIVIEAAIQGVPSILWEDSTFDFLKGIGKEAGCHLNYSSSPEEIQEILTRLWTDREQYDKLLELLRDAVQPFNWDNALEIWEKEVCERL